MSTNCLPSAPPRRQPRNTHTGQRAGLPGVSPTCAVDTVSHDAPSPAPRGALAGDLPPSPPPAILRAAWPFLPSKRRPNRGSTPPAVMDGNFHRQSFESGAGVGRAGDAAYRKRGLNPARCPRGGVPAPRPLLRRLGVELGLGFGFGSGVRFRGLGLGWTPTLTLPGFDPVDTAG